MPNFRHFTAVLAACACSFLPSGLLATTGASAVAPWLERPAALGEPLSAGEVDTLRRLYALGEPALRWFDAAGRPLSITTEALALLGAAADEGLRPADYRVDDLSRAVEEATALAGADVPAAPDRAAALGALDVRLSLSMVRFLRDLHLGRVDPRQHGWRRRPARAAFDEATALHDALVAQRLAPIVQALRPTWPAYGRLRAALPALRAQAAQEHLKVLPAFKPSLRPGDAHPGAALLHERLRFLGDLAADAPAPAEPAVYDPAWEPAVRRFQARHGLNDDGVIGPSTVAALNVPLALRVRQVELALERLRWMPHAAGQPLILVNLPMFRLWAYANTAQAPAMEMRVVVGRYGKDATPSMMEDLRYLVFRPYWNVPPNILRNEELPKIEADPAYVLRKNKEVVAGPADRSPVVAFGPEALAGLREGSLRLRQKPGPGNALGAVKFMMPNDEAIYLHDTPSRSLFLRERRDFSHGCVRVHEPAALATWVLRDQAGWGPERVAAAMKDDAPPSQYVMLGRPVPVALAYLTAWVEGPGAGLRFASDVYQLDAPLARAIERRRPG